MYYNPAHAPVMKKGLITSNPHCYNGVSNPHCMNPAHASYMNPAHSDYGVIVGWIPKKSRLAKCPKMQYWYDKYIKATSEQRGLKSFLGFRIGKKNKELRKKRKKFERLGKAAWDKCRMEGRSAAATAKRQESEAEDFSLMPIGPLVIPEGAPPPPPGAPGAPAEIYDEEQAMYASGPVGGGSNLLLYAGLGGGALLLLLLLRRK